MALPTTTGFPSATPFPTSYTAEDPRAGVNPYGPTNFMTGASTSGGASSFMAAAPTGASNETVAALMEKLGLQGASPGMTPEEAAAQTQAGLAKLSVVNPEMADNLIAKYQGQSDTSGGPFGMLKDLAGDIFGGGLSVGGKLLDLIGRTAHVAPALGHEFFSGEQDYGSAFVDSLTGENKTNWNTVLQEDLGWEGDGAGGVARATVGFALDVATDPLTYATFGAGAGVSGAAKGALAGEKVGMLAAKEAAAKAGVTYGDDVLIKTWRTMLGEADNVAGLTSRSEEGAEVLAKMAGESVNSAHRAVIADMFEAGATGYNMQLNRTLSKVIAKGQTIKLESGTEVTGAALKETLNATIKAGNFSRYGDKMWAAGKEAAGVMGGWRFRSAVPFTRLRYISPMMPFSNRLSFGVASRFANGTSASVGIKKAIMEEVPGTSWDTLATYARTGWSGLRKAADEGDVGAKAVVDRLSDARFAGARSAFYSASEATGKFTQHFTPGARLYRRGLGGYAANEARKNAMSFKNRLKNEIVYSVGSDSGGARTREDIMRRLEQYLKISQRVRKNVATPEDRRLYAKFMDYFGDAEGIPIGDDAALEQWFWTRPDVARKTAGAADEETQAALAGELADMKATLGAVTGEKRRVLLDLSAAETHGMQVVNKHGGYLGNTRLDYDSVGRLHPDDVPDWQVGTPEDLAGTTFHMRVPEGSSAAGTRLGINGEHVVAHEDDGFVGVAAEAGVGDADTVPVAIKGRNYDRVELNEAPENPQKVSDVLDDNSTVDDVKAKTDAALDQFGEVLDDEVHPLYANASSAGAARRGTTRAHMNTEALRGRAGKPSDGIIFTRDGKVVKVIVFDQRNIKVSSQAAQAMVPRGGYYRRRLTKGIRAALGGEGVKGERSVFAGVRDVEARFQRQTRDMTLDQAEEHVRRQLAEAGLDVPVGTSIFEHDVLAVHEDFVNMLAEEAFSASMGKMSRRMQALGELVPGQFGGFARANEYKWQLPQGTLRALLSTDKKAQEAALRLQSLMDKGAARADLDHEESAQRLSMLLEHLRGGGSVEDMPVTHLDGDLAGVVRAAEDFKAAAMEEQKRLAASKAQNVADRDIRTQVMKQLSENLNWADDMVVTQNADGTVTVDAWHGTHRGGVSTEPDAGTQMSGGGLHLGPRVVSEERIGSNDVGMYDIVDDTTGETVDTVEGRFVDKRIKELVDEAVEDMSGAGGGQVPENYSRHLLELEPDVDETVDDLLFPVRFKGKVLTNPQGEVVRVPVSGGNDDAAHVFGELAQGKIHGVRITWSKEGQIVDVTPLHTADDMAGAGAPRATARPGEAVQVLDQESIHQFDGVLYRNAVEGKVPSKGNSDSVLVFEGHAPATTHSVREDVEAALEAGELRVGKDGKVLTRKGDPRAGGRKVRTADDLDYSDARIDKRLEQIEGLLGGENAPAGVEGSAATDAASRRTVGAQDRLARDTGAAVKRLTKEERKAQRQLDRIGAQTNNAYGELNRRVAEQRGVIAEARPAIIWDKPAAGLAGFRQVQIPGLDGQYWHPYMAEEMESALYGKPASHLRRVYREHVLGPWKRWATYRNPGFHVRNNFGAWFNNFIGGVDTLDYEFSRRVNMARGGKKEWASTTISEAEWNRLGLDRAPAFDGMKGTVTYGDVSNMLADQGIGRANTTAVGFAGDLGETMAVGKMSKARAVPHAADSALRGMGALTEDFHRVAAWAGGMRHMDGDVYGARAFVMTRHGDYADLTDAEQGVKDLVPFYKWMRTNVPYQVRMLAENPGFLLAVSDKGEQLAYDVQGVDRAAAEHKMPPWMKEGLTIPNPLTPGNDKDFLMFDLPYSDLYNGARDYFSSGLPITRNILESTVLKSSTFTGAPLGEKMVPLSGVFAAPGIREVVAALPFAQKGPDGQVFIPDTVENVMGAVPLYSRYRNWMLSDPARTKNRISTFTSALLGFGIRQEDATAAELDFYYNELVPQMEMVKSMGIALPTADELRAVGLLLEDSAQPPIPADTLFPGDSAGDIGASSFMGGAQ